MKVAAAILLARSLSSDTTLSSTALTLANQEAIHVQLPGSSPGQMSPDRLLDAARVAVAEASEQLAAEVSDTALEASASACCGQVVARAKQVGSNDDDRSSAMWVHVTDQVGSRRQVAEG